MQIDVEPVKGMPEGTDLVSEGEVVIGRVWPTTFNSGWNYRLQGSYSPRYEEGTRDDAVRALVRYYHSLM